VRNPAWISEKAIQGQRQNDLVFKGHGWRDILLGDSIPCKGGFMGMEAWGRPMS
jgi:hypothetical protein